MSLTDHDNIEAGASLQVSASADEVPISVEWTGALCQLNLPPGDSQFAASRGSILDVRNGDIHCNSE